MKVKIKKISPDAIIPEHKSVGSAGVDLHSLNTITLPPLERHLFETGLSIELPHGYEAQIRPRSGLALKQGIGMVNTPGTIDSDYRGEIGVLLVNLSNYQTTIMKGDRIAQMVISKHEFVQFEEVESLSETERGINGYGSTGR